MVTKGQKEILVWEINAKHENLDLLNESGGLSKQIKRTVVRLLQNEAAYEPTQRMEISYRESQILGKINIYPLTY